MIPYIDFGTKNRMSHAESPFVTHDKPIVVFIDRETLDDGDELEFLMRQADGKRLHVISTQDEGSAHLEYKARDDGVLEFEVTMLDGTGGGRYGIPFVQQYKDIASSPEFTRWGTAEEIERAFIASKTAENLNAQVFITGDKILLEHKDMGIISSSYPLTLADGLALIGLILRRRNDYAVVADRQGGSTFTYDHGRWSFFWHASRDMLPAAWRLVTGCAQMDDRCRDLALTAIQRTSNALKSRDHVHEQIFLEQSNSSTEDAIFYLDYYLISFTAAFDVLARIAEEIYQPVSGRGRSVKRVTWRGRDWLAALGRQDSALAALMAPQTTNRDVLDFIARLRNYIHAEGLQGATHIKNGKKAPLLLHVPEAEVSDIADIITRIGGGSWVVDRPRPNVMFLELGELAERITPLAIEALNNLMNAIDITRVPGHDPSKIQTSPPADWLPAKQIADIRRLIGL